MRSLRGSGILLAALLALVAHSAAAQAPASPGARQAAKDQMLLQSWMTGSFSSRAQAQRDPAFRDLRLHVAAIWPAMSAAHWFYVEQAVAGHEKSPERQRVYRLSLRDDGRYEWAVFTLPAPSRFVGAWSAPIEQRLAKVTPDSLAQQVGCTIALRKQRDRFAGGTVESGCGIEGTLAFSTSEITMLSDRILVLERIHTKSPPSTKSPKGATEFVRVTTGTR